MMSEKKMQISAGQIWMCPVHGKTADLTFFYDDVSRSFCFRCIVDVMDKHPDIHEAALVEDGPKESE